MHILKRFRAPAVLTTRADSGAAAAKDNGARPGWQGAPLAVAVIGFSLFSVGDATVKSMSGDWPAPAVAALRYSIGALALAAIVAVRHRRAAFTLAQPWLQLGRGAALATATICFFSAAMLMPLADATAIQFTSPIVTAILAAIFLGERPARAVIGAILLGFAGVLLVLRPNIAALGVAALYPFGTALGMAVLIILNRKSVGTAPALVVQFQTAAVSALLLLPGAALLGALWPSQFGIAMPSAVVVLKCLAVAVTGTLGHLFIYLAIARSSAATVAPITYVQLVTASLLGWWWFDTAPDPQSLGGAALILVAGLIIWRTMTR